ncbi:hypothetical protein RYX36_005788 [Vicia faba]
MVVRYEFASSGGSESVSVGGVRILDMGGFALVRRTREDRERRWEVRRSITVARADLCGGTTEVWASWRRQIESLEGGED